MSWASQATDSFLSAQVQHDGGRQGRKRARRMPASTLSWLSCRASVVDVPGVLRIVPFISPLVGVVTSFDGEQRWMQNMSRTWRSRRNVFSLISRIW